CVQCSRGLFYQMVSFSGVDALFLTNPDFNISCLICTCLGLDLGLWCSATIVPFYSTKIHIFNKNELLFSLISLYHLCKNPQPPQYAYRDRRLNGDSLER